MGPSQYQRLEARRQDLQDQVVVYALTHRQPPERLVAAFVKARAEAEEARRTFGGPPPRPRRPGLLGRLFRHPVAG
jgi:hypothetical protein